MPTRNMGLVIGLALLVLVVSNALYIVKETERAVMLQFGEVVKPDIRPGLHWKIPFVNNVRKFDGRVLTVDSQPERFFTQDALLSQRINNGLRNQVAVRTIQEVVSGERDQLMADLLGDLEQVALEELGVQMVDVRVKQIDLPPDVSESVYRRMNAEREKEAREHRSQGQELAEGIRAAADREVTVIGANAYRDAELIRGEGDAEATRIYAEAFNQDPEFYAFTRSLKAYQEAFQGNSDIMLVQPDSEFFRYLKDSKGGN